MALSKYKFIIFDFDGTLIDSMKGFATDAAHLISTLYNCSPEWAYQQYHQTSGRPFPKQMESLFPNDKRNNKVIEEFSDRKKKHYNEIKFHSSTLNMLSWLKNR